MAGESSTNSDAVVAHNPTTVLIEQGAKALWKADPFWSKFDWDSELSDAGRDKFRSVAATVFNGIDRDAAIERIASAIGAWSCWHKSPPPRDEKHEWVWTIAEIAYDAEHAV